MADDVIDVKAVNTDAWLPSDYVISGRYELLRPLGSGGWGQVYLAQDRVLGRRVAVKRLLPSLAADPEAVSRFHREASVVASIQDAHVLTIFDTLEDGDNHYMVMEYADAGTLSQAISLEGAYNPFEALSVTIDICKGLRAVHDKGIIHRDVKPANVMFFSGNAGLPISKLGDFGIALQPEEQRLTPTNNVLGTLIYLSPEQATRGDKLTVASDIYSLGVMLYEMLSGQLEEPMFLQSLANEKEGLGLQAYAIFPEPIQPILFRALQANPEERFQTTDEMLQALERARGRLTASMATQRLLEQTLAEMRNTHPELAADFYEPSGDTPLPSPPRPQTPAPAPAAANPTAPATPAGATTGTALESQAATPRWIIATLAVLILVVAATLSYVAYNSFFAAPTPAATVADVPGTVEVAAVSTATPSPAVPPTGQPVVVLPTSTPTRTPSPTPRPTPTPTPSPTPTATIAQAPVTLSGPASLDLVFRDVGLFGRVQTLSANNQAATVDYQEGSTLWGEAITNIGARSFQINRDDLEDPATLLPDNFNLDIQVSPALQAAVDPSQGPPSIVPERGDFWVGQIRCGSATPPDAVEDHSLTVRLLEDGRVRAERTVFVNIVSSPACAGGGDGGSGSAPTTPTPPSNR
ncbi:MAG: serine/threonine-protein kinase [Anaerolineae bacterium]